MYKLIALLPMKANSERVKAKNFRLFNGKPLFRWILDSLLAIEQIEKVVINTDARSILAEHGLRDTDRILIRDRRPEICGDLVSMNLVLADDVANVAAETYLMTHTTNPLLSTDTIQKAIMQYRDGLSNGFDSLFTVNKVQTRFYRQDGSAVNHDPKNLIRTQDLESWFEENSNLYIFSKRSFIATNARIGNKPSLFVIPKIESADIDDQTDWMIAEAVSKFVMAEK
ncbi:MAG: acylneuraminate cytidylyltransferase family protein [Bacteroidota bacterium]